MFTISNFPHHREVVLVIKQRRVCKSDEYRNVYTLMLSVDAGELGGGDRGVRDLFLALVVSAFIVEIIDNNQVSVLEGTPGQSFIQDRSVSEFRYSEAEAVMTWVKWQRRRRK